MTPELETQPNPRPPTRPGRAYGATDVMIHPGLQMSEATDPETGDSVTVVSYNRPLTRGAWKDLEQYGILGEKQPREPARWTVVELETEPPEDLLDRHELRVEREPDAVYATDSGERVEIFDGADLVTVDGMDQTISPEDARDHADSHGWERLDGDGGDA